jgi:hypothetical protein
MGDPPDLDGEDRLSPWDRLVSEGKVTFATESDIEALVLVENHTGLTSDELLAETRGDH